MNTNSLLTKNFDSYSHSTISDTNTIIDEFKELENNLKNQPAVNLIEKTNQTLLSNESKIK